MRSNSSSLTWTASASRFCVLWIRNTMRKVTMVVPVFTTSCQVSLQWKMGPVTAQTTMTASAIAKASGLPVVRAVHFEKRVNRDEDFAGVIAALLLFLDAVFHAGARLLRATLHFHAHVVRQLVAQGDDFAGFEQAD